MKKIMNLNWKNIFWFAVCISDFIFSFWALREPEKFGKICRRVATGMFPELTEEIIDDN